jgi:tRNA(fMet)-specific endonuclease VapC
MVSAELWFGIEKNALRDREVEADRSRVEEFHDRVDGILYVTDEAIREYARLRALLEMQGTPISPNDMWIAAQALSEDARLVSANTGEFKRVPNLRLENWLK